jgi:hypothetical protein
MKTTLPAGTVLPEAAATPAVNVTGFPVVTGEALDVNVLVVAIGVGTCPASESLLMKALEPELPIALLVD